MSRTYNHEAAIQEVKRLSGLKWVMSVSMVKDDITESPYYRIHITGWDNHHYSPE